ncbi:potassium-transporting ATPase subunit KdpC [Terribacillus sp. DMT04]|nr:potassium-transporting ATPase subunit KdpC [Terribacillus sp. DMT04]
MNQLLPVLRLSAVCLVVCAVIYPLLVTGIGMLFFPHQANGSLIEDENGRVIGSSLIGQSFSDEGLFHGRISSIAYDASGSGSPNYAPSNPELAARTAEANQEQQLLNPDGESVPADLITNSASGLDPHISVEAAIYQVPRIAEASGITHKELYHLIEQNRTTTMEELVGSPAVNVLQLNMDIEAAR